MGEYEYFQRHTGEHWRLLIGCADPLTAKAKASSSWVGRRLRDSGDPIATVFVYGGDGWQDYNDEVPGG